MYKIEFIRINSLPFNIDAKQILYVSNRVIKDFENFLADGEYIEELLKLNNQSFEVLFIPALAQRILRNNSHEEFTRYSLPFFEPAVALSKLIEEIDNVSFSEMFFKSINYFGEVVPGLILIRNDNTLIYVKLQGLDVEEIKLILKNIQQIYNTEIADWYEEPKVSFKLCDDEPLEEEYADYMFDQEGLKITDDLISKINKIDKPEIFHYLIKVLSKKLSDSKNVEKRLSRLKVTEKGQILLIDYQQAEILLTPLQKAVFILFLKHPEGILFTALHFYRSELIDIYKELTMREHWNEVLISIEDLTDSSRNSINEKCSRIKSAFVKIMGDDFARYYYVTGGRGEPKKIVLPRKLIEWEKEF